MDMIVGLLFGLGALAAIATLLPIWKTTQWWVRACDFPRFQIVIIALTVFMTFAVIRIPSHPVDWLFLCALGLIIVWQLTWVGPYIPGTVRAVKSCNVAEAASEMISLRTADKSKLRPFARSYSSDRSRCCPGSGSRRVVDESPFDWPQWAISKQNMLSTL